MQKRNFEEWLGTFTDCINGYDYYTDFAKVYRNADTIKVELNILNSLIGERNIEAKFLKLIEQYPQCLKVIPILLATRLNQIYCQDENGALLYDFSKMAQSPSEYAYFMNKTGLFDLMQKHIIANLYDYATGIEVGLDSNARKNRGGHQMENLVRSYIKKAFPEYSDLVNKEKYVKDLESSYKLDLSHVTAGGTSEKRFDFAVSRNGTLYGIEVNFYTGGGSKLNEVARSYKMLAEEADETGGFKFVWITDGKGWNSAKRNLKETFDVLPTLYNINDLRNGALDKLWC